MAITYDFMVYSSRISERAWTLGMKAIHGEVPLDVVIPEDPSSDSENPEVIGVLTTEGLERESNNGFELYWYLRQLNPKKNETFGYNEVVIRNIHGMLSNLKVDEEIRVQITYNTRREPYTVFSYHIKLIGIFPNRDAAVAATNELEEIIATPPPKENAQEENAQQENTHQENMQAQEEIDFNHSEQPIYKTTNTLEKLINFTQNLQKELNQTQQELAIMVDKIQQLEGERQHFRAIQHTIRDIFDQLTELENFNLRIQGLEADRHQLQDLKKSLQKFLTALNQQTGALLQEQDDTN